MYMYYIHVYPNEYWIDIEIESQAHDLNHSLQAELKKLAAPA